MILCHDNICLKHYEKIIKIIKEVVVVGFQPWKCLCFSWTGRHKINIIKEKQKKFQWIPWLRTYLLYDLTRRSPKQHIFNFYLFKLISYLSVFENHKHVQGWNPTTTTSFIGIHNNNNKHGEKPNKKIGKRGCGGEISTLEMFMIFINRKT